MTSPPTPTDLETLFDSAYVVWSNSVYEILDLRSRLGKVLELYERYYYEMVRLRLEQPINPELCRQELKELIEKFKLP